MKSYEEVADAVFERREAYISEKAKKMKMVKRTVSAVSCFCLAVLLGVGVWQSGMLDTSSPAPAEGGSAVTAGETAGTMNSSVNYSSLLLSGGQLDHEIVSQFSGSLTTDIAAFDERFLSDCCAVLEGTITNMYPKQYAYDVYDDKFGETEVYHGISHTVVYELAVSQVWYGDSDLSGKTILVEDASYFMDEQFSLKVGGRYVVPLYDAGETIAVWGDYASGDISRDSPYSTIYTFHPQIEVTTDGNYVVSSDWETLVSSNSRIIYMDTVSEKEAGYYDDKMRLVDANTFEIQLKLLLERVKVFA